MAAVLPEHACHVLQGKVEGIITTMVLAAFGSNTQESVIASPDL